MRERKAEYYGKYFRIAASFQNVSEIRFYVGQTLAFAAIRNGHGADDAVQYLFPKRNEHMADCDERRCNPFVWGIAI